MAAIPALRDGSPSESGPDTGLVQRKEKVRTALIAASTSIPSTLVISSSESGTTTANRFPR